ncbi:MAG TPA: universal stress protein [Pseudonocardia sp.]|nr:universal stress protein [Pseudonocardia sp.]
MTSGSAQGPVVVGVDGSDQALEAVRWGAREAARRRATLRLVQAFAWPGGHHVGEPYLGVDERELLRRTAREQVADAAAAAAEVAPGLEIEREVRDGHPSPLLVAESRRAQLVVLGDRGLGGFTGLLVGSVAVELAAHAACPVVVVRGAGLDTPPVDKGLVGEGPIVVGVDGSPTSEAAVAFAFEAAASRGVPLVAVHTWQDLYLDPAAAVVIDWQAVETEEKALLSERLAGWCTKYPDVEVRRLVQCDRPARVLVEQSRQAQLVVVGSRGRGGFRGLLLGSVSQALLHHSACPVAVVRPEETEG